MPTNFKQLYAKKKYYENLLTNQFPNLDNDSGIYIFERFDENGKGYAYVGQAKHLIDRLVSHLMGYSQHIDISLKKRGLKCKGGEWLIDFVNCSVEELDNEEKRMIEFYNSIGHELYNITGGGQGVGKVDINERKPTKTYRDGLSQGYNNCKKEIKTYFEKYLNFSIKGETSKIKEKKLKEFEQWLTNS